MSASEVQAGGNKKDARNKGNKRRRKRTNKRKGKVLRQYSCESCDSVWWSSDSKQVSTCFKCFVKYDPVPKDKMFGWAQFSCQCGNKFSGFGQMNTTASECYTNRGGCGKMVYPTSVKPSRRGESRSESRHSCDAPDCFHRKNTRISEDGTVHFVKGSKCVHPNSSKGSRKRVVFASIPHVSSK